MADSLSAHLRSGELIGGGQCSAHLRSGELIGGGQSSAHLRVDEPGEVSWILALGNFFRKK